MDRARALRIVGVAGTLGIAGCLRPLDAPSAGSTGGPDLDCEQCQWEFCALQCEQGAPPPGCEYEAPPGCGATTTGSGGSGDPPMPGAVSAVGRCVALGELSEMGSIDGTATFNQGLVGTLVPLDQYADQGLIFRAGYLLDFLPGIQGLGWATQPEFGYYAEHFPPPIGGGAEQSGLVALFAGVAELDPAITRLGLTASDNGTQFLTAWAPDGTMLGQVQWVPASGASFVGIDCSPLTIRMVAYGNDDLWNGEEYGVGGLTVLSDTWVWSRDGAGTGTSTGTGG